MVSGILRLVSFSLAGLGQGSYARQTMVCGGGSAAGRRDFLFRELAVPCLPSDFCPGLRFGLRWTTVGNLEKGPTARGRNRLAGWLPGGTRGIQPDRAFLHRQPWDRHGIQQMELPARGG